MDDAEIKKRLVTDEDFVNLKRFDYSIEEVERRYPDGVPDRIIAQGLNLSDAEYEALYHDIVIQLRQELGAGGDEPQEA